MLQILVYFQNCDVYFINRYLTVWGFTIVFPQFPLFPKLFDFSIHLLIPAYGQFVTIKTSQDEFSFKKKLYFTPKQLTSHTRFFLAKYRSPNGPHLFRMVQPIRSPENPGTTVVNIGHLTPWPENPGYHTQVWDKLWNNNTCCLSYTPNTMPADALTTLGASASAGLVLHVLTCKAGIFHIHRQKSWHIFDIGSPVCF